jgi:hypothetical protein
MRHDGPVRAQRTALRIAVKGVGPGAERTDRRGAGVRVYKTHGKKFEAGLPTRYFKCLRQARAPGSSESVQTGKQQSTDRHQRHRYKRLNITPESLTDI